MADIGSSSIKDASYDEGKQEMTLTFSGNRKLEELLRDEEPDLIEKDERERPDITWDTRRKPDMVRIPRSNRAMRPIRRIQHRWRSQ